MAHRKPTLKERWRIAAGQFWSLGRVLRSMPTWLWMAIDPKTTVTEGDDQITLTSKSGYQSFSYRKPACPKSVHKVR